jgi:hypothetical protein
MSVAKLEPGSLVLLPDLSAVRHYYELCIDPNATLNRLTPVIFMRYTKPQDSQGRSIVFPPSSLKWFFADRAEVLDGIPAEFRDFMLRWFLYDPANGTNFRTSIRDLERAGIGIGRSGNGEFDPYLKFQKFRVAHDVLIGLEILHARLPFRDFLRKPFR